MKVLNKFVFMGLFLISLLVSSSGYSDDLLTGTISDWQDLPRTDAWDVEENGFTFESCYSAITVDSLFEDLVDYLDEEDISAFGIDDLANQAAYVGQHIFVYNDIPDYLDIWRSSSLESPSSLMNNIDFGLLGLGRNPNASTLFKRKVGDILETQDSLENMSWVERIFSPDVYIDMFQDIEDASRNAAFANEVSICADNESFRRGMTSACCNEAADMDLAINNYWLMVDGYSRDGNGVLEFNGFGERNDAYNYLVIHRESLPSLLERDWPAYLSACDGLPGSIYTILHPNSKKRDYSAMEQAKKAYLDLIDDVSTEILNARRENRIFDEGQFYGDAQEVLRKIDFAVIQASSGFFHNMQADHVLCNEDL